MSALLSRYPLLRNLTVFSALVAVVVVSGFLIAPLLVPVILAGVLYTLLNPINSRLIGLGLNRSGSTLLVLVVLMSWSVLALALIVPRFAEQLVELQALVPRVIQVISDLSTALEQWIGQRLGLSLDGRSLLFGAIEPSRLFNGSMALELSNLVARLALIMLLVPILTYFLLRDYRSLRNRLMQRLGNRHFELGWLIYHRVARQLQTYIRGVMLQSVIVALVASLGFALLGLEMALLLGCMTGLLNLIPYVGPLLALVPPLILTLGSTPFEPVLAIGVIGVIGAAQIVDNVLVIPTVIASAVDLHPLTVILGVVVFGNLFGFIGMVVAIPALSTAKIVYCGLRDGLQSRLPGD